MIDPNNLMWWIDNWRSSDPGRIDGKKLILIALQKERRFWKKLIGKTTKNWIYNIDGTRLIVYKPHPKSPAVMKMGLSGHFLERSGNPWHRYAISMEQYAKYFIDKIDLRWLQRNDYELVEQ